MAKKITVGWVLLVIAVFSALLITVFNAGGSDTGGSGAGEIWWVDVPEVEQSYRKIMQDR